MLHSFLLKIGQFKKKNVSLQKNPFKNYFYFGENQSQKEVRLPPSTPLNVGCKFAQLFLAAIARHSFSRLGTALNQGKGEVWVFLSKSNNVLELFNKNLVSLNNFL